MYGYMPNSKFFSQFPSDFSKEFKFQNCGTHSTSTLYNKSRCILTLLGSGDSSIPFSTVDCGWASIWGEISAFRTIVNISIPDLFFLDSASFQVMWTFHNIKGIVFTKVWTGYSSTDLVEFYRTLQDSQYPTSDKMLHKW